MTPNDKLLAAIKSRQERRTEFGYGISTADRYVKRMQDCAGLQTCYRYFTDFGSQTSFNDVLLKAARTLTYRRPI